MALLGQGGVSTTDVINGQMVAVNPAYAIAPAAFGPAPVSYDMYAATPTTPPYSGMTTGSGPASAGGGTDQSNVTAAAVAAANPFSWKLSPLMWSMLFLIVGLAGLRLVHWGRG